MRLQKRLVHSRYGESVLDDQVRCGKSRLDVAACEQVVGKAVGGLVQRLGQSFISRHVGMNDRRAFLERRLRIEHRRQLFVVDLNEIKSVLGLLEGIRRDRGDALAHEARAVLSQD